MAEIGISTLSERSAADDDYRRALRAQQVMALEGYNLSVEEYKTLRVLVGNQWFLPGDAQPTQEQLDAAWKKAGRPRQNSYEKGAYQSHE